MEIKFTKLTEDAIIPTKGSINAAGYDLYATTDEIIPPFSTTRIGTGLAFEIPEGYFAGIYARSGLATKEGLRPANCVGVCDSDYRGEYIVALHNDTNTPKTIKKGTRIAQLVVQSCLNLEFVEADILSNTDRANGGFGSTGK